MGTYSRIIALVLFLGLLLVAGELSGLRARLDLAYLHQILLDNKLTGLSLFALMFALGNLIQIPGWIFLAAAVLALGRTAGGIATYIAACFSCAVTFFIIRHIGGDALRQIPGRTAARILDQLNAYPVRSIVLLRILFQTLPAINYALALSGVGFPRYMLGTLLGLPLPIAAYCVFFDYLKMFIGGM